METTVVTLCKLLDEHLGAEEEQRSAVSLLSGGVGFEAWLAFETRLIAERNRAALGLEGTCDGGGSDVPRYWMQNEYRKVDLYVGDLGEDGQADTVHLALELKLIHNNKNWKAQADRVRGDLFPTRAAKSKMRPKLGRHAIVGVVGKVYRAPASAYYPGQVEDLGAWEQELEARLLPPKGWRGKRVARLWKGRRFEIRDPWLRADARSFFQLHLLSRE